MRKGIRLRQEDLKEPESVSHSDVGGLYKIIILRDDYIPKLFGSCPSLEEIDTGV